MKGGILGDFLMWAFLGAGAVLAITQSKGLSTAVGTVIQPVEYESGLIATAGKSAATTKSLPT